MGTSALSEAKIIYDKAVHLGRKEGGTPLVLDHILKENGYTAPGQIPLGVIQVPLEQIVGTKTEGRMNCFSQNFYPLLDQGSEFSMKWINLCAAHLEEGIHDPVKAYEFLNKYYVIEGNKRVSVLKYYDAVTIPADVIRLTPPQYDAPKFRIYFEYCDFYELSEVNYVYFSKPGSFSKLQKLIGKKRNESWSADDKTTFSSIFYRFKEEYIKVIGKADYVQVSDAFLYFITLYNYRDLFDIGSKEFHDLVLKSQGELKLLGKDDSLKLQLEPTQSKPSLLKSIIPRTSPLNVSFILNKNPELSGWTYAHDMGCNHIKEVFGDAVKTNVYYNVDPDKIEETIDDAIANKPDVIFSTSQFFMKECLKASLEHPEITIMNCGLSTPHKTLKTYYARMYEVKYIMGAIAGALSENHDIGVIADYPIAGNIAGINAFALGAKMVNPFIKVHLLWSKTMEQIDIDKYWREHNIQIICDKDTRTKVQSDQRFGLYKFNDDDTIWNMAMAVWNWSAFYEKIISKMLNKSTDAQEEKEKSLTYWWGLSSGIVDIIYSGRIPIGTIRLIELLKTSIINGTFIPYGGYLTDQSGNIKNESDKVLSTDDIITMDWLVDNIIGSIPDKEILTDEAKQITDVQAISQEERTL